IKPNFLWMMYRSGWGSKTDQEAVLAIRIRREAFESILAQAVHSSFVPAVYKSQETWKESLAKSDVRLQWDPDHGPTGAALERRAIQLGLRGEVLAKYGRDWILEIQDVSALVREQRVNAAGDFEKLAVPREEVYVPVDPAVAIHLGIAGK
ncbi:MAG TPA: DUF4291 family protein, partial [Phycisphaerae bacterium]|nr:DUF4291 family protein [Phycisphaerae bacterium]